jgi:hypothetical protein
MKKTGILLIALISAVTIVVVLNSVSAVTAEETWVSKAKMPTARACVHVATVEGKIYVIGGGGPVGTNEEYDPKNDLWTTKTSMLMPEQSFAIAVFQNKIYCIGGENENQVYDPSTDTWEIKTSMPTARYGAVAGVVDGKIYVIGGAKNLGYNKGNAALNLTEVYDPTTGTWTTKAAIPYPTPSVSAVIDNKIYLIGSQITQSYNPTTDTWSTCTSPIEAINMGGYDLSAAEAATIGTMAPKRIYVYDGTNLQIYNAQTDSWTNGTAPPTSRQNLSIGVVDDRLYFIGGMSFPIEGLGSYYVFHAENEEYTPLGYGTIAGMADDNFLLLLLLALLVTTVVVVGTVIYLKKRK